MTISDIAEELNIRSVNHPIGNLQSIRSKRSGKRLLTHKLFDSRSIFEDDGYAYHVGGRTELQYNIGLYDEFRYGVAFSLKPSRNLPDITTLLPNIGRFNEFLRAYPDEFSDLLMWHWDGTANINNPPGPIPSEFFRSGFFIFLGELQPVNSINYDRILDLFDKLLPLYQFVQGDTSFPAISTTDRKFNFVPGCTLKQSNTTASISELTLDVSLRHNDLQFALYRHLEAKYGKLAVRAELGNGAGARIDVVVRQGQRYWFYEIKTASSSRGCIREALSQLIEYSLWPGAQEADRLIIVGEAPLDADSQAYLRRLKKDFGLPIEYQQFDIKTDKLL